MSSNTEELDSDLLNMLHNFVYPDGPGIERLTIEGYGEKLLPLYTFVVAREATLKSEYEEKIREAYTRAEVIEDE